MNGKYILTVFIVAFSVGLLLSYIDGYIEPINTPKFCSSFWHFSGLCSLWQVKKK